MMAIRAFFRWLGLGCSHASTYRERRPLHGLQIIHFVCADCGHAEPVIDRTAREHRRAVKLGAVATPRARHLPADIVKIGRGR